MKNDDRARDVSLEMRKRGGTTAGFESVFRSKDGVGVPVLISAFESCLIRAARKSVWSG